MAKIPDLLWGSLVGFWVSFFLLRKLCDFLKRCLASRQNEMMWNKSMKQSHMLANTLYLCKSVIINFSLMPRPHDFSEWGLGMKLINFDPCKKKKTLLYTATPCAFNCVQNVSEGESRHWILILHNAACVKKLISTIQKPWEAQFETPLPTHYD